VTGGADSTLGSVAAGVPERDAADMTAPPTFLYVGAPDVPEGTTLAEYRRARRPRSARRRRPVLRMSSGVRAARRAA
jgi:hypothetical protein